MKNKLAGKAFLHIKDMEERLSRAESNLQYISRLKSLKYWLDVFANALTPDECLKGEWAAYYEQMFFTGCGFSFYEKVALSIEDYNYGNKPF